MAKIHEVAEAAGVSISTVSYALSGKRSISPATRERVERAAARLGYEPNAGARMLAGRRTHIFALTEPFRADTHAPTHMSFVLATSIAARRYDYDILLLTDAEASAGMRRVSASGLVDGILVLDVAPQDDRVALSRAIDVPTVFIGVPDDAEGLVCVDLDFEAAAGLAVDRLAEAGHRRIGFIGHPETAYVRSNFPPRVRRGVEDAARRRGVTLATAFPGEGDERRRDIGEAVRRMIAEGVTALALHCDDAAHAAVLAELTAAGLAVPAQMSVVSIGSSFDTSSFSTPLDRIPLEPDTSCELAVELASRLADGEHVEPGVRLTAPHYQAFGSVSPPR
ncbi:Catabolite control protein A [Microbacterium sp. 8M]|uniref:LacI family DNA-binding transcriptional regulator n=1 Tax=Microbacterium sp. 8M TaxID=2653153 RepID=UPI0012F42C15|nr:LacI family DNA-binding transcriptional regulator [Microbacterium sp. 8M]VXB84218.1 Catabolite control protein A [Microbacterium sp. 8M]